MEITIAKFKEQYLPELKEQFHAQIQKSIVDNKEDIARKLQKQTEGFIAFLKRLQKEIPVEIGEVQIALLQTSVHMKNPQIAFCAYDENGILGKEVFNIKFDGKWLFQTWEDYEEAIHRKINEIHAESYIRKAAIHQMMWESMDFIIYCLYAVFKYLLQEFFKLEGYEELLLTENFRLSVGGYRDWSRTLYRKRPKIDIFFRDSGESLQYGIFKEIVYNRKEFNETDLTHTYFIDCEFVHSHFSNVTCRDAIFENCRFYHCTFDKVDFCGATFRNVTMKKDTFKNTTWYFDLDLEHIEEITDIYKNVELEQCILEYVTFEDSDVRGIQQSGCHMKEISLQDCENDESAFKEGEK